MHRPAALRITARLPALALALALGLGTGCGDGDGDDAVPGEPPPAAAPDDAPPSPPDPAAAAAARAQARERRKEGNLPAARDALEEAHAADPTDTGIARELAELLLANLGVASPARALEVLDRSFGPTPATRDVQLLTARASFRIHAFDRCRALVESWFDGSGMPPVIAAEAHFLLGSVAERRGEFTEARAHFDEAVREAPQSGTYRCRLGIVLEELGEVKPALRALERAGELQPGLAEVYWRLSSLYRSTDRANDADLARRIHLELNRYTDNRAETEEAYLERYAALETLARIHPSYTQGRVKLAEFQLIRGLNSEAVATTHALLAEQADLVAAWRFYIEALRRDLGDEAARKRLSGALQEFPDLPEAQRTQILKIVLEGFAP